MTLSLDYIRKKAGGCPNTTIIRTAPVVLNAPSVTADASIPLGRGRRIGINEPEVPAGEVRHAIQ